MYTTPLKLKKGYCETHAMNSLCDDSQILEIKATGIGRGGGGWKMLLVDTIVNHRLMVRLPNSIDFCFYHFLSFLSTDICKKRHSREIYAYSTPMSLLQIYQVTLSLAKRRKQTKTIPCLWQKGQESTIRNTNTNVQTGGSNTRQILIQIQTHVQRERQSIKQVVQIQHKY